MIPTRAVSNESPLNRSQDAIVPMILGRILVCTSLVVAAGCHAWHEPPLEPIAVTQPPVEFETIGPPIVFGPPHAVDPIAPDAITPPPFAGMPWGADVAECVPPTAGPPAGLQNPLFVPVSNQEAAWREIVDVMDDYFRIAREEPVHAYGGVLTEGHIATRPLSGASGPGCGAISCSWQGWCFFCWLWWWLPIRCIAKRRSVKACTRWWQLRDLNKPKKKRCRQQRTN